LSHQIARQEPEIRGEFKVCDAETRAAIAYQHLCDDSRGLESLNRHETRLSAELRRTLKLLDAELKNQKFHHEPSPAKPPHSDEDRPAPEAPRFPSTIDHRPPRMIPTAKRHESRRPDRRATGNQPQAARP